MNAHGFYGNQICNTCEIFQKNEIILEHKTWVEELKMEKEYQLCLKEMNYEEKLKKLTEKFNQQMDSITKQNQ
ncbi:cilia- and flagella-associated protein 57 isoform X1, partial [Tachysurus ichikawai]